MSRMVVYCTCSECWEPFRGYEGDELCEWCRATPAERRRIALRSTAVAMLVVAVVFTTLIGLLIFENGFPPR